MAKIIFIQFTNPTAYPPLEQSAIQLQKQGWECYFIGIRWHESGNFGFANEVNARLSLVYASSPGLRLKFTYLYYCIFALTQVLVLRPDWIYVSDPIASPIGLILRLFGYKVVYHEHDSPNLESRSIGNRAIRFFRDSLARLATVNVLPQIKRTEIFRKATKTTRPVLTILNCPRISEVNRSNQSMRQHNEPLGIYYHGSINLTRLPMTLIEAAGQSGIPVIIRAIGYETAGSMNACLKLKEAARKYNKTVKLELPGSVGQRSNLFEEMKGMHIGWVAYPESCADINMIHLAGASNKAFDYLAGGLALIVNSSEEWEDLYITRGVAIGCDARNVESVTKAILSAYNNPKMVSRMGEIGKSIIEREWNYEGQFKPLLERLNSQKHTNLQ